MQPWQTGNRPEKLSIVNAKLFPHKVIDVVEYIHNPERLDRDSLYELRSLLALYPYFQTARILLLQNLYLLHDPTFDEELRRAAIYITDRRVLFQMIEAAHYRLSPPSITEQEEAGEGDEAQTGSEDRTISLIDNFLQSIPQDEDGEKVEGAARRKPTPADAAVDYVAYLMETEGEDADSLFGEPTPPLRGQGLIDNFLENEGGRIKLPQDLDESVAEANGDGEEQEEIHTEALARIYVKQRRYSQAYDIILQLSKEAPQRNAYYADQLSFLEKLIVNERAAARAQES
jgi:hypothetical protein